MKNKSDIEVRIIRRAKREDIIRLYKDAGWWEQEYTKNLSFVENITKDSFCFAGAFHKKEMIGMGRALSDGCSDAYIQDVVVLKKFRGNGIGAEIIKTLISHLQSNRIDWIGLVAQPGTESFYKELGFRRLKGHIPMKLE
jgi:ribosomal protein S18 acetylase RimI-like enzyme